jgi:hypothetical protein
MWFNSSIERLKTEKPFGQLGLQKIDEEESGTEGAQDGDDERPLPALRKNPFHEKEQKEKRGEGKTDRGQEDIINNQGKKGRQNPFPRIGLGKERGSPLHNLLPVTSQEKGDRHEREGQSRPERQKPRARLRKSANLHSPGVEGKKNPDHQKKNGCNPVVAPAIFHGILTALFGDENFEP